MDQRRRPFPAGGETVLRECAGVGRLLVTVDDVGNGPLTSPAADATMREFATGAIHLALTTESLLGVVVDGTSVLGRLNEQGVVVAFSRDLDDVHSVTCRAVATSREVTVMCAVPDAALELRVSDAAKPAGVNLDDFAADLVACAVRRFLAGPLDVQADIGGDDRTVLIGVGARALVG